MKKYSALTYLLSLSLGFVLVFASCEKADEPMDLPPAESLSIDWDAFPQSNTKSSGILAAGNWVYSTATVFIWNVTVAGNILIPTVAYSAAFNYTPVYLGDNSWEWSYSVPVNGKTINASLIGTRLNNETFSMEMTLSEEGGFQNFRWFEGVIRYDHTEASWTLSHSPGDEVEYLRIDYSKDYDAGVSNIRYTVIDPLNELYNAYIDFGIDPDLDLDAHYNVSKSEGSTTYIEWNRTTKAGHVKDQQHFGDDLWHCWDGLLQDVDCTDGASQFLEGQQIGYNYRPIL
jgi:hypothetical protein